VGGAVGGRVETASAREESRRVAADGGFKRLLFDCVISCYILTILMSLIVAMLRTNRFTRTMAGPSKGKNNTAPF